MRSIPRAARWRFALAAVALVLAGCGGAEVPPDHYYRLTAPAELLQRAGGPLPGDAEVERFRATGLLNERGILYRAGPGAIDSYNYHLWWQPPGILLQQSLIDALRSAHAFGDVAGPEMQLPRTYDVVGRIQNLEQDGNQVTVNVDLAVRYARTGAVLLFKTYTAKAPVSQDSMVATVSAFSTAVAEVWVDFIKDLNGVTPPPEEH